MAKMGKMELERYGGARWVLELIDKIGLEEARKELEWRGVMNAPLNIEVAEIRRFENDLKESCKRSLSAMTCMTLHDEFGFGHDRLEKFIKRWNLKVDCLHEDLVSWEDYASILKEECGIDIDVENKEKEENKNDQN